MTFHFEDDEPLELDCGCVAEAGDCYVETDMAIQVSGKRIEHISVCTCEDEFCIAKTLFEKINKYGYISMEVHRLKTASEKELECAEMMGDR